MNEGITNNTTCLGIVFDFGFHSTIASAKHLTKDITSRYIHVCTRLVLGRLYAIINGNFIVTDIGNITTTIYISIYSGSSCHGNACASIYTGNVTVCGILSTNTFTTTIYIAIQLASLNVKRGVAINDSGILFVVHGSISTAIYASKDRHTFDRCRGVIFDFTGERATNRCKDYIVLINVDIDIDVCITDRGIQTISTTIYTEVTIWVYVSIIIRIICIRPHWCLHNVRTSPTSGNIHRSSTSYARNHIATAIDGMQTTDK